ncbi:MAG: VOC family protein [Pseudomonadales bacterium]
MATIELDHLMWGAPSLACGMEEARRLFGAAPAPGGVHPGLGTQNALLSLGEQVYLEVIAPDPAQKLDGTLGAKLATMRTPGLITWAAATTDLETVAARAAAASLRVRGPVPTQRQAPDGSVLRWRLLFLGGHDFGSLVPFFIDWQDTPHPARTNPPGGRFERLEVRSPRAEALSDLYARLGLSLVARPADEPGLTASIDTANGEVRLLSADGTDGWSL